MVLCCKRGEPRPRDGPWAWLISAATFVINVLVMGFIQSFGVLLPVLSDYFGESRGKTAWVGSLASGLAFATGLIAVKLSSHLGHRMVSILGGLVCMTSLVLSSFVREMWVLFFSYGLLFGLGGGCIINTEMAIVTKYFKKRLTQAVGIITSGASLGVMVVGPTLQIMLEKLGWRNTLRVMAGAMLFVSVLSLTYDPNVESDTDSLDDGRVVSEGSPRIDCSVWSNPTYTVGLVASVLTFFGLYVPLIHMVRFGEDLRIPSRQTSQLFIYIGIVSIVARLLTGHVLNKGWLSPLHSIQLSTITIATAIIAFTQATRYTHFVVFVVFYGFANGAFATAQAVFYLTYVEKSKAVIGFSIGLMVSSVAICFGPAACGFIADRMGSYIPAFYIIGGIVALSSALPFILKCIPCDQRGNDTEHEAMFESQLKLIGSRLAIRDSVIMY